MDKSFAKYEKECVKRKDIIKHIIKVKIDSSASEFKDATKQIPDNAILTMFGIDTHKNGYNEIQFEEYA